MNHTFSQLIVVDKVFD